MIYNDYVEVLNCMDSCIVGVGDDLINSITPIVYDYNKALRAIADFKRCDRHSAAGILEQITQFTANHDLKPVMFLRPSIGVCIGTHKNLPIRKAITIEDGEQVILQMDQDYLNEYGNDVLDILRNAFSSSNIVLVSQSVEKIEEAVMNKLGWYRKEDSVNG